MKRIQVYPEDRADPTLRRVIAEALPDLLFVWHPGFHVWQAYRSVEGQWDAFRLWNAMCSHTARKRDPEWAWWKWRGAPQCVAQFDGPLGEWVVEEMRRRRMDHYPGGRRQWIRDFEGDEKREQERMDKEISDLVHDAVWSGFYRVYRDYRRGDPLAGKRKWVVGVDGFRG